MLTHGLFPEQSVEGLYLIGGRQGLVGAGFKKGKFFYKFYDFNVLECLDALCCGVWQLMQAELSVFGRITTREVHSAQQDKPFHILNTNVL